MKKHNTIIVAGAGPAGIMAVIRAAELGNKVILIERNHNPGRKLLLTGKGRCNLTNCSSEDEFYKRFSKKGEFLRDAFKVFFVKELMDFFESNGQKLKIERQNRVFPVSDSSLSVLNVLENRLSFYRVELLTDTFLSGLLTENNAVKGIIINNNRKLYAEKIVLALGGASYSFTGSDGSWHNMLRRHGIGVLDFKPGLVPLTCKHTYGLEGLTLKNISLNFKFPGKVIATGTGELLFTHKGISGPLVLTFSAKVLEYFKSKGKAEAVLDLKPALTAQQLDTRISREVRDFPRVSSRNLLKKMLPLRLADAILNITHISPDTPAANISKKNRLNIIDCIKAFTLDITGSEGMQKAMVTRGGVSLKEINPRTMQSRSIKNLYFCGEMIDLDADTGGFNLQAAFSTGYLAGQHAGSNTI